MGFNFSVCNKHCGYEEEEEENGKMTKLNL